MTRLATSNDYAQSRATVGGTGLPVVFAFPNHGQRRTVARATRPWRVIAHGYFVIATLLASVAAAQPKQGPILKPGEFPPADTATYIAGELVVVDPANRRGALRLDGDGGERYHD